jgi:hypothetical protein
MFQLENKLKNYASIEFENWLTIALACKDSWFSMLLVVELVLV